jgi:hypothetical protein
MLDPNGAGLWTTVHFPLVDGSVESIGVAESGRAVLSVFESLGSFQSQTRLVATDPASATEWTHITQNGFRRSSIGFAPNGDVVVGSGSFDGDVIRLDTQGSLLWSFALSGGIFPEGLLVDAEGRTWISKGSLSAYDASGVLIDADPLNLGTGTLNGGPLALDARGNVVALTYGGSFLNAGPTVKAVLGTATSNTFCPAQNPNSTGLEGELEAIGTSVVSIDNVTLLASNLPTGVAVLPLASAMSGPPVNPPGSQGTLCLSGAIGRFVGPGQVRQSSSLGTASLQLGLDSIPTPTGLIHVTAGQTYFFQAWHRDANPGATSNFTSAVEMMFQ